MKCFRTGTFLLLGLHSIVALGQQVYEIEATKRINFRQTGVEQTDKLGAQFRFSIVGEDLSDTFPKEPRRVDAPNGATKSCVFSNGAWLGTTEFAAETELDAAFPDGWYSFAVGDYTFALDLEGPFPAMPFAYSDVGRWKDGKLIIYQSETKKGFYLRSAFHLDGGLGLGPIVFQMRGIDNDFSQTRRDGVALMEIFFEPGVLGVGKRYKGEFAFHRASNYFISIPSGFAFHSLAAEFEVNIVPDPLPSQLAITHVASTTGTSVSLSWKSAETLWSVETSEDLAKWSAIEEANNQIVGTNVVTIPVASTKQQYFRLKAL